MFSQACVENSVQGGGACMAGGMHGRGVCVVGGGACVAGGMHDRGYARQEGGHAWQGVCMGGMHDRGACIGGRGMCGRRDGHCSGRYATYWDAFLFKLRLVAEQQSGFPWSPIIHSLTKI